MTPVHPSPLTRPTGLPRRAVGTDRPLRALALAALVAFAGLWLAAGAPPERARDAPRVALVVDAGASPQAALDRARAWAARTERGRDVEVAVRVPRTATEAAADVRYFAAQGYATVVAAGPRAGAAAARAAADGRYAQTRFESRPAAAP